MFWKFIFTNTKSIVVVLGCLLMIQGIINVQLYNSKSKLENVLEAQIEEIKSYKEKIELLEQKELIRNQEIQKWKDETVKKDSELQKATIELLRKQSEIDSLSQIEWDSKAFTNNCESNIDILRNHAIKIKGKLK